MNTEKDLLKNLFDETKMESTSGDFISNLMNRIEKEDIKRQNTRLILNCLSILAGVAGIICIPALILFLLNIKISFEIGIFRLFSRVHIESYHIMFALIILCLLIGDTLLRKRFLNLDR